MVVFAMHPGRQSTSTPRRQRTDGLPLRRALQRAGTGPCACGGRCPRCEGLQPVAQDEAVAEQRAQQLDSAQGVAPVPAGAAPATAQAALPPLQARPVVQAGGQPLDAATRHDLQPRLGHDLAQVRVHDDGAAAASAAALNAAAYTWGPHIVFGAGRHAPRSAEGRRLLAHELVHVRQQQLAGRRWLARQVADPAAEARLQQVLLGDLQAAPGQPCAAASAYFQLQPPVASDASLAHGPSDSLVEALLASVRSVRQVFDGLHQALAHAAPDSGEMKLALSGPPGGAERAMIAATARAYRLNIEVLVPQALDGSQGAAAVARAAAEGQLATIRLVSYGEFRHAGVAAPDLDDANPCTPLPPDQIVWKRNSAGLLHIDAGGEGKHPEANNLNWTDKVYGGGGGPGLKTGDTIPNHVCGNIKHTWPIGDRRADIITVHGSPIHPPEVARVIRDGGHISLTAGGMPKALKDLLALLGPRVKTVDAQPDVDNAERAEIDLHP